MRIACLSWRDSTHPDGGGSEVYVERVAAELVSRGHEVTIVCARHPGSSRRSRVDGVVVERVGGRLGVYPRALLWLLRHRRRVDVVVDVINGLPFATPLVRRRGVVALVHHLHERQWHMIYPGLGGHVGWWVESRLVPRLYRHRPFLTVSRATAHDLQGLGIAEGAVTIARNGTVPSARVPVERSGTPRLVVLARLVPHKRIEHAVDVLARLSPTWPDLELDLVGDGWWRDELEAHVARAGMTGRVHFHGHVDDQSRDELLARAWLALMPSVKEGWCLAVTEAGAQGTPTIAYASAGGVRESIDDGVTGLLVDDLDGMVDATGELLASPERRAALGRHAGTWARQHTWSAAADAVERVLAGAQSP